MSSISEILSKTMAVLILLGDAYLAGGLELFRSARLRYHPNAIHDQRDLNDGNRNVVEQAGAYHWNELLWELKGDLLPKQSNEYKKLL